MTKIYTKISETEIEVVDNTPKVINTTKLQAECDGLDIEIGVHQKEINNLQKIKADKLEQISQGGKLGIVENVVAEVTL